MPEPSELRKSKELSFDQLVENIGQVVEIAQESGAHLLIAGGVGLDLLATKYLSGHRPRAHKDIDAYIRDFEKGRFIDELIRAGVDPRSFGGAGYFSSFVFKSVPWDLINFYGNSEHGFHIPQLSLGQQRGSETFLINPTPDVVTYKGEDYTVLDINSQQQMPRGVFHPEDRGILTKILGETQRRM